MDGINITDFDLFLEQWSQDQPAGNAQNLQELCQPSIRPLYAFDNQSFEPCQWPCQDGFDVPYGDHTIENMCETMLFNTDPTLSLPAWKMAAVHTMDGIWDPPCPPTTSIGFCRPEELLVSSDAENDVSPLCGNFKTSTLHSGSLLCQPFILPTENDLCSMQQSESMPNERSPLNATRASLAAPASSRNTLRTHHSRSQRCKLNSTAGNPCNQTFSRTNELIEHQQTVHGEISRRFDCRFCDGKSFARKDSLTRHLRKAHRHQQQT